MSFFSTRRQIEPTAQATVEKQSITKPVVPTTPVGFETVLGASSSLEGVFRSSANVRLDGTFSGTLEINGNVLVGETAKINADINARNVSIAGAVRGNVNGKKVLLLRTGRIWGDIRATALTTEEGAFIDGKITMVSHEAASTMAETSDTTEPDMVDRIPSAVETEQETKPMDEIDAPEAKTDADGEPSDTPKEATGDEHVSS